MTTIATAVHLDEEADIRLEISPFGTRVVLTSGTCSLTITPRSIRKARELAVACEEAYQSLRAEKRAREGKLRSAMGEVA